MVLAASLSLFAAYLLSARWPSLQTPANVHVTLFALPLLVAGALLQGRSPPKWLPWLAPVALAAVATGLLPGLDIKASRFGTPGLTVLGAAAVVGGLLAVAPRLAASRLARPLHALGAASMVIMFTHQAIQLTLLQKLQLASPSLRTAAALMVGWGLYKLALRSAWTRTLFLGRPLDKPERRARAL